MKITSTNPSKNYMAIGSVTCTHSKQVAEIVAAARNASLLWQFLPLQERVEHITTLKKVFEKEKKRLVSLTSQEMGMPLKEAEFDVDDGLSFWQWYLDHAPEHLKPEISFENESEVHTIYKEPFGVMVCILPWNFPFSNFVWKCIQALLAGNVLIVKHSEEVILFGQLLEDIAQKANLPPGVLNFVHGDGQVGQELVNQEIDVIAFKGSFEVGQLLYAQAARKFIPVSLELGGSAPGIVCADAEIDQVLDTIYFNRFLNCGQVCDGLKRLIVHHSVEKQLIKKLTAVIRQKKVGPAEDSKTDIGPLVSKKQLIALEAQIQDAKQKGARVLIGGDRPSTLKGAYFQPTMITGVTSDMKIWTEEVFGPVLPIVTFSTEDEAVKMANDTVYGLGGYVFTQDFKRFNRIARKLKSGMVQQNQVSYIKPCNPFGGYKKSGLGREHARTGFDDVTQVKVVSREK